MTGKVYECPVGESIMVCETEWDDPPTIIVFKGHNGWPAYTQDRTCHIEHWGGGVFYLSCGHDVCGWSKPNYCPECGAKVVNE